MQTLRPVRLVEATPKKNPGYNTEVFDVLLSFIQLEIGNRNLEIANLVGQ